MSTPRLYLPQLRALAASWVVLIYIAKYACDCTIQPWILSHPDIRALGDITNAIVWM